MIISHVTYDSNNDIKMPPRMPKIITILARIENRPTPLSSVILYLLTKNILLLHCIPWCSKPLCKSKVCI